MARPFSPVDPPAGAPRRLPLPELLVRARSGPGVLSAWRGGYRLVADAAEFMRLLQLQRPLLVLVFAPPATMGDIEEVARERRSRTEMRAVLIDRPDAVAERLAALRSGFDAALDDGAGPFELAGRLELLLEQASNTPPPRGLQVAPGLVLDVEARRLRAGTRAIHLRPRECALLAVFCRWPGRTFSRRELLAAVGAGESLRGLRSVDVHIRWLREKLEQAEDVPVRLVTVRGVGYRLQRETSADEPHASVNSTLTDREQAVDGSAED
jgi:DNA-binding response OmpR family regulator